MTITRKEPVGVCGSIIPWNYPVLMAVSGFFMLLNLLFELAELRALRDNLFALHVYNDRCGSWDLHWPPVAPLF